MESFKDYYSTAVDIANCVFGGLEAKNNIKESVLQMCVSFANLYESDMNFRKEADLFVDSTKYRQTYYSILNNWR